MRNLTKAITAISLLVPVSAFSLGIGDISLHSSLNQKLDAEISLHVSAGEQISDLEVKLAPPEKFDEAGVPWHYFLSKIKFETVEAKNGATVIKVTSKEVLREPFLDFLVEVSWDKGSIYREFTVLIDPPVAYTQPVIPVIKPPTRTVNKKPVRATKKEIKPTSRNPEKAKVDSSKKAQSIKKSVDQVKSKAFKGGEYGPVAKNEALWGVADKTNIYQGVSRTQMMVAIYNENPKAFYKQNINALKAGAVLKIPDRKVILKLTRKEALKTYKQQVDEWNDLVNTKSKSKPANQKPTKKSSTSSQQQAQAAADKKKRALLKLKAPTDSAITGASIGASSQAANNDQSLVPKLEKTIVSLTEENSALQAKMKSLEQQLAVMENMIVLRNKEAAASLQKQNELARAKKVDKATVDNKSSPNIPPRSGVPPEQPTIKKPVVAEPALTPVKVEKKPVVEPSVAEPVLMDRTVESEDEGFSVVAIGGLILSALGLAGWGLWRKKKKKEGDENEESMFASSSDLILSDPLEGEETTPASIDVVSSLESDSDAMGSSFLSEFSSSDFHTFDIDPGNDVDPVLEADVYLAYGRYQQAEELMRQAISDHPERDECKLKLLEIFHASDNQSAFDEYMLELEKAGKNKDQEFWAKVVEMGDELDVSAASESTLHDEKVEEKAAYSIDNTDQGSMPQSIMDNEAKVTLEKESEEEEEDIEFDLSIFDDPELAVEDEVVEEDLVEIAENNNADDDFDLDEFDFDSTVEETSEKEKEKILDKVEEMESVDFDLDSLDLSLSEPNSETAEKEKIDTSQFESFDFDTTHTGESGDSDLTDMDEIETKIDLAKAYIDMGDYDAARNIAQDAFDHGNDEQKKAAKAILDMLD